MKGNPSCRQYIEQFTWLITSQESRNGEMARYVIFLPVYGQWPVFLQDGQGLRRIQLENG